MSPKEGNAYMFDLMALVRTISWVPNTYASLAKTVLGLDFVAGTLKNLEWDIRGVSNKVLINSDSANILSNLRFLEKGY